MYVWQWGSHDSHVINNELVQILEQCVYYPLHYYNER